jgi:signal transduction histidine kinase
VSAKKPSELRSTFRPRARILQLLGDELIGSPRLAVFELVKNAYDADANEVTVTLDLDEPSGPSIVVTDDGEGMNAEVLRDVWLVPGDDHRQQQRASDQRSRLNQRLPLGEKGLGRFAVHKLGNRIQLVTRARNSDECSVEIDWQRLIAKPFLENAPVTIRTRKPEIFTGQKTGTRIEISDLRQPEWSRGEVRRLQRQITSICSPFEEPSGFRATLRIPGHENWIEDIPDVQAILEHALWKFTFRLKEDGRFDWTYTFRKIPGLKIEGREVCKKNEKLRLPPPSGRDDRAEKKVVADRATTLGIGPVSGQLYAYDRDREVLRRLSAAQLINDYLDDNGGIRVYRDGIRVYNYGEAGDDWLGLDLRRVNAPTRGISRNIILGAVHLSLKSSTQLIEKTNREGFVENDACGRLRRIVLGALSTLETERELDKERIRKLTRSGPDPDTKPIQKPIEELRKALGKKGVIKDFEPYVAKIEHDYREMQETLLSAGMSGLNLAVVFHEVERGVRALHQVIVDGRDTSSAVDQARELMHLLDGFSTLLRRDARSTHTAAKLIGAARQYNVLRLRYHQVQLVCPILESGQPGFEARFSFSLVLGALNNLIDNSLYWLRVRWPDLPKTSQTSPRKIYLGVTDELAAGRAVVLADTGPGFQGDDPERLVRPFFTRKPTGMGLGLYYANMAMELNGGQLVFPGNGEADVPAGFDGAVVAMAFKAVM